MAMWSGLMSNPLKTWHVDQIMLLPPSSPRGTSGPLVQDTVQGLRDLSAIVDAYTEHRGFPPYDPTMMTPRGNALTFARSLTFGSGI